jgi:pseudouridylate synthase
MFKVILVVLIVFAALVWQRTVLFDSNTFEAALERRWRAYDLVLSDEVRSALLAGKATVALESTIIAHGMPYPQNMKTALEVEQLVRDGGAVPATVAVLDGAVHVGLNGVQMERLARDGASVGKTSRRDLAAMVALKKNGATTVAGTMMVAERAGIRVFVTGGLGGVHRGGESSMDVSADIGELGRTSVAVVCAGVKSILDIGRTLEALESAGVTVIGFGVDEFPSFFTRHSGHEAPMRVDTEVDVARIVDANVRLELGSGIVVGVPVPADVEADSALVERAIGKALAEVDELGIAGKRITPYLLKRVAELTDNASLRTNIALVKNNAAVGAAIAVGLARLEQQRRQ